MECEENEERMALVSEIEAESNECQQSKCVPELLDFLEDNFCQDDCSWKPQNECQQCFVESDPYGYQSYWLVIMEFCVCSHEDGSQICDANCESENFLPEEIEQECITDFLSSGTYQAHIESCYISDFATECANNLLCQSFWDSFQECQ